CSDVTPVTSSALPAFGVRVYVAECFSLGFRSGIWIQPTTAVTKTMILNANTLYTCSNPVSDIVYIPNLTT
ncbi:hypothetical protein QEH52_16475, partial [Coraliomargarita sp. SDUM461003]